MPINTVKVDRTTRWGNPMRVRPGYSTAQAVQDYRYWLAGNSSAHLLDISAIPPTLNDIRLHLGGKNLACWCRIGDPCHADVLLHLANPEEGF